MGFKLLDCTIRDGGYINDWDFDLKMVQSMYEASSRAGTDIFEIGFLSMDTNLPLWRQSPAWAVKTVKGNNGHTLISAMLEDNTVGMVLDIPQNTGVDILRVALNKGSIESSLPKLNVYKEQGYQIFIQLMGITSYRDVELLSILELIEKAGSVDYVNIGDSYGSLLPDRTTHIISLMKANTKLKVGLHPHNNMQLGMANIMAAIEAGADVVDCSMYGMGRGGGNAPLELFLTYYGRIYPERFDALPVLSFIDLNLLRLRSQFEWGYSLPSLLSGVYECHPYYVSKLVDKRAYTIEQILQTVKIVKESDVIGFSDELLNSIVDNGFVALPEKLEHYVNINKGMVVYFNRHKNADFVILANGPSLVEYQSIIGKYIAEHNAVTIGSNNISSLFEPNYHSFSNQRRFEQYASSASSKCKLLIGPSIVPQTTDFSSETIICYNSSETKLEIQGDVITSNCGTVALLSAAVAIVMGARSVCFAGFDGYLSNRNTMFYNEEESKNAQDNVEKHELNQRYLDELIQCATEHECRISFITPTTYVLT